MKAERRGYEQIAEKSFRQSHAWNQKTKVGVKIATKATRVLLRGQDPREKEASGINPDI